MVEFNIDNAFIPIKHLSEEMEARLIADYEEQWLGITKFDSKPFVYNITIDVNILATFTKDIVEFDKSERTITIRNMIIEDCIIAPCTDKRYDVILFDNCIFVGDIYFQKDDCVDMRIYEQEENDTIVRYKNLIYKSKIHRKSITAILISENTCDVESCHYMGLTN